jgi:DNA-binding response OmpR family regulator
MSPETRGDGGIMEAHSLNPRYAIILDTDPSFHSEISKSTGVETRWYPTCEKLVEAKVLDPIAAFVDARLTLEGPMNGQLIIKLKDSWPLCPIFLTTNSDDESDLLADAMALGADDFIAKPITTMDLKNRLNVRISALARKAARETIDIGDVTIDTLQRSVTSTKGQKFLSPTEIKLLSELAKSSGKVVPRETLKTRCWPQVEVSDNALNRKLYEVRKRIQSISGNVNIRTIYGVGFVLEERS